MIPLLADIDSAGVEGLIVCLIVVALVAGAVYLVCGHLLHQTWAPAAAAIIFALGALLCLL